MPPPPRFSNLPSALIPYTRRKARSECGRPPAMPYHQEPALLCIKIWKKEVSSVDPFVCGFTHNWPILAKSRSPKWCGIIGRRVNPKRKWVDYEQNCYDSLCHHFMTERENKIGWFSWPSENLLQKDFSCETLKIKEKNYIDSWTSRYVYAFQKLLKFSFGHSKKFFLTE